MTAMMTDFELENLEAFEFDRPCTPWKHDCGEKATWLGISTCCGLGVPLCEWHAERTKRTHEQWKQYLHGLITCEACGTQSPLGSAWYRWEKL